MDMHIHIYRCICVCIYVHMYICEHIYLSAYIYTCMHLCMYFCHQPLSCQSCPALKNPGDLKIPGDRSTTLTNARGQPNKCQGLSEQPAKSQNANCATEIYTMLTQSYTKLSRRMQLWSWMPLARSITNVCITDSASASRHRACTAVRR